MEPNDCCPDGDWCQDCGHDWLETDCDCTDGWCWACGEDGCDGDCEPAVPLRPVVEEMAFARLGIL